MTNKSKSKIQFVPILILAIGLVVILYLINIKTYITPKASPINQDYQIDMEVPPVNSNANLQDQLDYLDSMDIDQIDQDINRNYSDAQDF